jgi:hypothetical protein
MQKFMDLMYERFAPLLNTKWFELVMSLTILLNPVAITPQVLKAFMIQDVSAISVPMWYLFAAIEAALTFSGIKARNAALFVSMLISMIESITIIVTIYVRG